MNNIELRLMVERDRREEILLTGKYASGKKTKRKNLFDVMNNFPAIIVKEISYIKLISKI